MKSPVCLDATSPKDVFFEPDRLESRPHDSIYGATVTNPTRISDTFAKLKQAGHLAFMPFITAGDPDMVMTVSLIQELGRQGVDLIEIGFPYSDPIADGPVIQASYTRALNRKLKVEEIFDGIATLKTADLPPLVGMVSYALLFRRGVAAFMARAAEVGFAGLIIPDLPADEATEAAELAKNHGLNLVQLIAPTTPRDRALKILKAASGFVYCISIAGTTGVRDELPPELQDQLAWLRQQTSLPLAVGFGISRPDQVDVLRNVADGVIVGTAIVKQLDALNTTGTPQSVLAEVGRIAASLVSATHKGKK